MGTLIEQKKAELEQRKKDALKVELYGRLARLLRAIIYIIAELDLGYKPELDK